MNTKPPIRQSSCFFFVFCFLGLLFTHPAQGIEPVFNYKVKTLIVEQEYTVKVADFMPVVEVEIRARKDASYDTPEDSTITQISAMSSQDYSWWLQGWGEESKKLLIQRDTEMKRSPKDWEARWNGLKNAHFILTHKIEYFWGGIQYIAVGYQINVANNSNASSTKGFESAMVFKRVDKKWKATQDLKEDPVFSNAVLLWGTADLTVRVQNKMKLVP